MKNLKYLYIPVMAGLILASCNEAAQGPSQADIDQQVEAKVKEATDKLKSDCDAQIMNAAQLKKDSVLVKMGKAKPAETPKPATKPTATQKPVTPPPTKQAPVKQPEPPKETPKGLKSLSDQSKQENKQGGGLKSLSDQSKQQENKQQGGGLKSLRDNK